MTTTTSSPSSPSSTTAIAASASSLVSAPTTDNKVADSASRAAAAHHTKPTRICYYYSKRGKCRDGDDCRFIHDRSLPVENAESSSAMPDEHGMIPDRRQAVTKPVPASRVVQKPIPDQDPREFQLGQIRRRFSPKESLQKASGLWDTEEGSLLQFKLPPSDPDFPFEMTALECSLLVPTHYPDSRPTLKVDNKDIPRGYAVNVESGFDELAQEKTESTLLELIKALDRNLEVFLSAEKAETVKIVPNKKDTRHLANLPIRALEPVSSPQQNAGPSSPPKPATTIKYEPTFTKAQKAEAFKRREAETRQIEARMGRLPLFKKSGDGIAYTIPIEPRRRSELPVGLQAVKTIQLFVPLIYPLQICRVQLGGVEASEAKSVEKGFEVKAAELKETTLMGHVNYLAQNMHTLAKTVLEEKKSIQPIVANPVEFTENKTTEGNQDPERSHIQYIARPPEWTIVENSDAEDSEDDYSYDTGDETTSEEEEREEQEAELKLKDSQPVSSPERGTAISFPFMELYGIELLEIATLNITVKCDRCKDIMEVRGLKNGVAKSESCKKCAVMFSICFRRDLMHPNSVRAGFLDLEGCTVGDMLLSSFVPTCSECSNPYPLPGIVSVQGETTSNVCRECHQKFTFKLPSVKFLRITSATARAPTSGPRRKKEVLGIVAGTELPKRGRCRHYAKSYRWFRFSCCQKVYACDKCHDGAEEHLHEWANRMICGWCSREGNYRPEDCGVCHQSLVGKKGGGFWEGGKGTRDQVKMNRRDKRKFRRIGSAAKKS